MPSVALEIASGVAPSVERRGDLLRGGVRVPAEVDGGGTDDVRGRHGRTGDGVRGVVAVVPGRRDVRAGGVDVHDRAEVGEADCSSSFVDEATVMASGTREGEPSPASLDSLPAATAKVTPEAMAFWTAASSAGSAPPPRLMLATDGPLWFSVTQSMPATTCSVVPEPWSSRTRTATIFAFLATPCAAPAMVPGHVGAVAVAVVGVVVVVDGVEARGGAAAEVVVGDADTGVDDVRGDALAGGVRVGVRRCHRRSRPGRSGPDPRTAGCPGWRRCGTSCSGRPWRRPGRRRAAWPRSPKGRWRRSR